MEAEKNFPCTFTFTVSGVLGDRVPGHISWHIWPTVDGCKVNNPESFLSEMATYTYACVWISIQSNLRRNWVICHAWIRYDSVRKWSVLCGCECVLTRQQSHWAGTLWSGWSSPAPHCQPTVCGSRWPSRLGGFPALPLRQTVQRAALHHPIHTHTPKH